MHNNIQEFEYVPGIIENHNKSKEGLILILLEVQEPSGKTRGNSACL